jgi:hypothetical protein
VNGSRPVTGKTVKRAGAKQVNGSQPVMSVTVRRAGAEKKNGSQPVTGKVVGRAGAEKKNGSQPVTSRTVRRAEAKQVNGSQPVTSETVGRAGAKQAKGSQPVAGRTVRCAGAEKKNGSQPVTYPRGSFRWIDPTGRSNRWTTQDLSKEEGRVGRHLDRLSRLMPTVRVPQSHRMEGGLRSHTCDPRTPAIVRLVRKTKIGACAGKWC